MNEQQKLLFSDIIRCGQENCQCEHGMCHRLLKAQVKAGVKKFQVPEPWNGEIDNARLVLVSINPGVTPNECYPDLDEKNWNEDRVIDFFEHRFDSKYEYVIRKTQHQFGTLLNDGSRRWYIGYWNYAQSIGRKILGGTAQLGKEILLTELVHCKSEKAAALRQDIYKECVSRFWNRFLQAAIKMEYLVVVGDNPRAIVSSLLNIKRPAATYTWYDVVVGERKIRMMFVDHNANGGTAAKIPVTTSAGETPACECKPKKESSSENLVNPKTERNTINMNAEVIINRINNEDIVLGSAKRKWKRSNKKKTTEYVAYNVGRPPLMGPKARKIIMRLKPVAQEPSKLEVAFYIGANNPRLQAFQNLYNAEKRTEKWFEEENGEKSDAGVKSTISLATVGETEWQGVVADEMDRLFDTYYNEIAKVVP